MNRVTLEDINLVSTDLSRLHVFTDDHGKVLLLPALWLIHLSNTESIYGWRKLGSRQSGGFSRCHLNVQERFEMEPVSESTIENYVGHLYRFLNYINDKHKSGDGPSVHHPEVINSRGINHYLNDVLAKELGSIDSLMAHSAALKGYFNFLYALNLKEEMNIRIYPKTRKTVVNNNPKLKKVSYVTKEQRIYLLRSSNNLRDRLIIRLGYEVGLRTEELTGLVLSPHRAKKQTHKGLLQLFEQLTSETAKDFYAFTLNGKYAKRGKTRVIYFEHNLLVDMKTYYETERNQLLGLAEDEPKTLLLRMDPGYEGRPISKRQGSNTFSLLKKQVPYMNQALSYHDLRHTFATELYHQLITTDSRHETRSESAALIEVGKRLGHSDNSSVTKIYIRLRMQMLSMENNTQQTVADTEKLPYSQAGNCHAA